MAKKKEQQMSTDVAKALWETYAGLMRDRWVAQLEKTVMGGHWSDFYTTLDKMKEFKFDFNRSNK